MPRADPLCKVPNTGPSTGLMSPEWRQGPGAETSDWAKVKAGRLSLQGLHPPAPSCHSGRAGIQLAQAWGASFFCGDPSLLPKVLIGEISASLRGEGLGGGVCTEDREAVPSRGLDSE